MAVEEITGMYDLLDALEEALKAADPAKRKTLAETIDAYAEDFGRLSLGHRGAVTDIPISSAHVNRHGMSARWTIEAARDHSARRS